MSFMQSLLVMAPQSGKFGFLEDEIYQNVEDATWAKLSMEGRFSFVTVPYKTRNLRKYCTHWI